ncbi:MAG: ROK family protein [Thermoguttaceae bacterium]|jgi:glucokinase|nr:ROK family protein [Thermoguttaceae bacterium]
MPATRQLIAREEAKEPFFVGVDLGGTTVKLGLVDDLGRPLCWDSIATCVDRGPEDAARRMGRAVLETIRRVGLEPNDVAGVGLGSPGILDYRAGTMVNPTNFKGWNGFPIRDRVAHHCGLPVVLANDASCAAYGEFWIGSGRGFRSLVMLTLGTGVGCGVIIGDLIIEGENGHGTECGHIIVEPGDNARVCSCGRTGHLEAYASATAVVARTQDAIDAGRKTSLSCRLGDGTPLSPLAIAEEAEAGDDLSLEIVMETARYLGIGIVSLLHTIDPTGVLIGGAMTFGGAEGALGRRFLDRIREEVRRRAFPILAERTTIDFATLGPDAGYLGAAGIARVEHRKTLRRRGADLPDSGEASQATRSI